MARVIITESLKDELISKFKAESVKIIRTMKSLEKSPSKGKIVGHVQEIIIKELKHGTFRFYFITDGHLLKFGTEQEIARLLIKFVRMSGKKDQQKAIDDIKNILKTLGFEGF
ncbi:hypothetical protein GOV11_04985 [Candidatus Woesearchaeota archaeon]|nr:hypothetical protein [Candidatus Woesearchaeota archaeon]